MANMYFLNTGNSNWANTTNWSNTNGGLSTGTIPLSTDAVFFTSLSGNVDVSGGNRTVASLNFTGYTGTWSGTSGMTVNGNVTLSATMTITNIAGLTISTAGPILTSNGKTWPNTLTVNSDATFADNWTVGHLITTGTAKSLDGGTISVLGNFTCGIMLGNAPIVLIGTGTFSQPGARVINPITINAPGGTITMTGTITIQNSLTWIAGTVISTGATMVIGYGSSSQTFDLKGLALDTVTMISAAGLNLISDMRVTTLLTLAGKDFTGAGDMYVDGNVNVTGNTGYGGSATSRLILSGLNTTWSGDFNLSVPLMIDTLGTVTISGTVGIGRNFTYVKGTVNTTGSTLKLYNTANQTINSGSIVWNTVNILTTSSIITLTSPLVATNLINSALTPAPSLLGDTTITVANFSMTGTPTGAGLNISPTIIMRITTSITSINLPSTTSGAIRSSTVGTRVSLTLDVGATCNVGYLGFTDINASGGRTINTWNPVAGISNCINVNSYTDGINTGTKSFAG